MPENVWVAMAIGYSKNGYPKEALLLYCDMLRCFVQPSNFAFSIALKSCAELSELRIGRVIHGQISKSDEEPDQVVCNALLRLYAECGCFEEVLKAFDEMPERNVASWNSLISGFMRRDQLFEAFGTFRRMQKEGVGFSWVTLTTLLPICARVTALNFGKEIHTQIIKSARIPDILVLNSLMDMYAKCGVMYYCMKIFDLMENKDLTTWNTVITGFAINGNMRKAMEIFDEMLESGFRPDGITFIALLSGCSHAGLTNEGRILFYKMSSEFGTSPKLEHYACLVDILGRGGKMEEALEIVKNMPMKPSGSIWGSLLNSCRLYGNVPLSEAIAKRLFAIEPKNPGNYVMLSNIYANAGMWEGVDMMREIMEKRGVKKEVGCSWIQIKSKFHTFVASGGLEFRSSDEFKHLWDELTKKMKEIGYVPDTREVLHNVNEEMKVMWVCGHSERIATMYGLIHTGNKVPIRITKNLRVCRDCHSWMKMVSKVMDRVVTLRDTNRFHHFEDGMCSCKDFW